MNIGNLSKRGWDCFSLPKENNSEMTTLVDLVVGNVE
jgi:hypothetical protein